MPHAARTFLNSLAFQKRLFDFTPTERITVLLTDFEDGGRRHCQHGAAGQPRRQPCARERAVRNGHQQRPHEPDHEPRAGPHRDDGPGRAFRSPLPASVLGQGAPHPRAAGIDPVLLPHDAPRGRAALVSRGHRHVPRHLDGRRPRARAERVRRDGVPLDGQGRRRLLRSARPRVGRHRSRLHAADQLVSVRDAVHGVAGSHLRTGEAGRVGGPPRRRPCLLRGRVRARLRPVARTTPGRAGSRTSAPFSRPTSPPSASSLSPRRPI